MTTEPPKIKLSREIPPIFYRLNQMLGVKWGNIIICDNETFYSAREIPPEKMVHELEHVHQQKKLGRELFWDLYLSLPEKRLEFELEAYKKEYAFIVRNVKDRNARFHFLYEMARNLSGETYGKIISASDAMRLISKT